MSYKSQLFPLSSTGETTLHRPIGHSRGSSPPNLQEMKFFRSWLVYESDLETIPTRGRVKWNMVLGLTLATAISASFWACVGLVIAHLWK
jgi:hypothetical protein